MKMRVSLNIWTNQTFTNENNEKWFFFQMVMEERTKYSFFLFFCLFYLIYLFINIVFVC